MQFQVVRPSGFLACFVKDYCFIEAGREEVAVTERVIPTEHVQLMFHYKDPFVNVLPDALVSQPRCVLSGLTDTYIDVSTHGETGVVFVRFYPEGASSFFGFSLSEVANQSIDLKAIFNTECRELEEQLYETTTLKERITLIEGFLLGHYTPLPAYDRQLMAKTVQVIKQAAGQTSAVSLSSQLAVTPKSLERKCARYLGKSTKQVIQLFRFQAILQDFSQVRVSTATERALRCGYFDQSHFIRDFKRYTGLTPGEFADRYPDFDVEDEHC